MRLQDSEITTLQREIIKLTAQLAEAKNALEVLMDWQNGPPLLSRNWLDGWNNAMAKACNVVGRTWDYHNALHDLDI